MPNRDGTGPWWAQDNTTAAVGDQEPSAIEQDEAQSQAWRCRGLGPQFGGPQGVGGRFGSRGRGIGRCWRGGRGMGRGRGFRGGRGRLD